MNTNGSRAASRLSALELSGISAGYGRATVLRDVSVTVAEGSVVALLGPNGAGKTTLLRVAAGLLAPTVGEVRLCGDTVTRAKPFQRAKRGLCLVPEGRGIFPNLSVRDNLRLQIPPWSSDTGFESALDAFPVLKDRLGQKAGSMSGGEQQMVALARCFLADPKVVLLDEVSMGLAPRVVDEIFEALHTLRRRDVALVLVEQYVSRALQIADRVDLLVRGNLAYSGSPAELTEDEVMRRYLGTATATAV
jgi:branched-chain amino acid transport system ATP-binding protein